MAPGSHLLLISTAPLRSGSHIPALPAGEVNAGRHITCTKPTSGRLNFSLKAGSASLAQSSPPPSKTPALNPPPPLQLSSTTNTPLSAKFLQVLATDSLLG